MHMTRLRKVGGSVMLAVPPALLEIFRLQPGELVGMSIEGQRLVVDPSPRRRYTLQELLEASDYSQAQPAEEREWVDAPTTGREQI